ncbi:hypothetical protein Hypma_005677 [Hypsizygus marmoreus]|uniref:Uncharacterized protein n=1 Tax=Hypsizygus marmoreus TaxID=39966 RepID=A0A369JZ95_HYPMA|nr:hypothetical protein Hypma_005677 [Hypsizygus marmoreus]
MYPPTQSSTVKTQTPKQASGLGAGEVNEQPRRSVDMEVTPGEIGTTGEKGEARRMRGGCVPCPGGGMCWIIPLPCC